VVIHPVGDSINGLLAVLTVQECLLQSDINVLAGEYHRVEQR